MLTYLRSTLAIANAGGYAISQSVPTLGWQHKHNGGAFVFAVRHDHGITSAQAKRAAEAAAIIPPAEDAPQEDWVFDYDDLAPGRIVNRGRPVKEGEAATSHIHLRVTPERKSTYVKRAQASGRSLSDWMTETCDREAGYQP
ncbi:MAG: hypothetical protein QM680_13485 [Luteolibacter sp.]